jgi:predicted ester cyclase
MSTERNKEIARRLYEDVVGRRNFSLIDSLVAADALDHNALARGWGSGIEGVRVHATILGDAFANLELTVDDLVAEGDRVIVFWHFTGIHRGAVWGVQPTGRAVKAHTISLIRFRDGKVTEYESRPDRLALLLQLGSLGEYAGQLAAGPASALCREVKS